MRDKRQLAKSLNGLNERFVDKSRMSWNGVRRPMLNDPPRF
jgi:hypothetical protein